MVDVLHKAQRMHCINTQRFRATTSTPTSSIKLGHVNVICKVLECSSVSRVPRLVERSDTLYRHMTFTTQASR